jgi:hypothetical protein
LRKHQTSAESGRVSRALNRDHDWTLPKRVSWLNPTVSINVSESDSGTMNPIRGTAYRTPFPAAMVCTTGDNFISW